MGCLFLIHFYLKFEEYQSISKIKHPTIYEKRGVQFRSDLAYRLSYDTKKVRTFILYHCGS